MKFTEEDKLLVRKLVEIKNKGYYVNSSQLTAAYNRILEKNVNNTNCGSCMRQRISELEKALKQWEAQEAQNKAQEALKQEDPGNASSLHSNPLEMSTPTKAEEKQPNTKKEDKEDANKESTHKTKGRKKK